MNKFIIIMFLIIKLLSLNDINDDISNTDTSHDNIINGVENEEEKMLLNELNGNWLLNYSDYDEYGYEIYSTKYVGLNFFNDEFNIYQFDIDEIVNYKFKIDEINTKEKYIEITTYEKSYDTGEVIHLDDKYRFSLSNSNLHLKKTSDYGYFEFVRDDKTRIDEFEQNINSYKNISIEDKNDFIEKLKGIWVYDLDNIDNYKKNIFNKHKNIKTLVIDENYIKYNSYNLNDDSNWSEETNYEIFKINNDKNYAILKINSASYTRNSKEYSNDYTDRYYIVKINNNKIDIYFRDYNEMRFYDTYLTKVNYEELIDELKLSNNLYKFSEDEKDFLNLFKANWVYRDENSTLDFSDILVINDYYISIFPNASDVGSNLNLKLEEINTEEKYIVMKSDRIEISNNMNSNIYDVDCTFKIEYIDEESIKIIFSSDTETKNKIFEPFNKLSETIWYKNTELNY